MPRRACPPQLNNTKVVLSPELLISPSHPEQRLSGGRRATRGPLLIWGQSFQPLSTEAQGTMILRLDLYVEKRKQTKRHCCKSVVKDNPGLNVGSLVIICFWVLDSLVEFDCQFPGFGDNHRNCLQPNIAVPLSRCHHRGCWTQETGVPA